MVVTNLLMLLVLMSSFAWLRLTMLVVVLICAVIIVILSVTVLRTATGTFLWHEGRIRILRSVHILGTLLWKFVKAMPGLVRRISLLCSGLLFMTVKRVLGIVVVIVRKLCGVPLGVRWVITVITGRVRLRSGAVVRNACGLILPGTASVRVTVHLECKSLWVLLEIVKMVLMWCRMGLLNWPRGLALNWRPAVMTCMWDFWAVRNLHRPVPHLRARSRLVLVKLICRCCMVVGLKCLL